MFRKFVLIAALAMSAPISANAANVSMCGKDRASGPYDVSTGDVYTCKASLKGSAVESITRDFVFVASATTPNPIEVSILLGGAGDSFSSAKLEWLDPPTGGVVGAVDLTDTGSGFSGSLKTMFSDSLPDRQVVRLSWTGYVGDRLSVDLMVAPVPVPAAGLLMLTALGGFGMLRRRRKTA